MIRIKDDCIELSLGGRVATLASGGTPSERLVEAKAQLQNVLAAAEELAGEARNGDMSDGTASPLRIVRKDGRGSVSRGQVSVTVTYRGLMLGRAMGDRVGVRSVMVRALEQTGEKAAELLEELNRE
ncbi:hypothetical protein [Deinococcus sp. 12RED42]|uniref:hypothetical protein n=1 Tax=Deinococcus sp. 12RED42 TaxID=2745872 RepID=UPI001E4A51F0|nr:hypothetical protein [Deinococcus sp. 12RED42]MCD0164978.1 hypothetical protein [Deinococcus sp. 12RED42]